MPSPVVCRTWGEVEAARAALQGTDTLDPGLDLAARLQLHNAEQEQVNRDKEAILAEEALDEGDLPLSDRIRLQNLEQRQRDQERANAEKAAAFWGRASKEPTYVTRPQSARPRSDGKSRQSGPKIVSHAATCTASGGGEEESVVGGAR